jgi:serralysin
VVADDSILLDALAITQVARNGAGGILASSFTVGTAATTADHRIVYNSSTGALLYDVDGVGGAAAVQFASLTTRPALTASEFFLA